MNTAYRPEIRGARTVRKNLVGRLRFAYSADYLPRPVVIAAPQFIGLDPRMRPLIKLPKPKGLGPHLLLLLSVPQPILRFRNNVPVVSEVTIPVLLDEPLKQKKIRKWLEREMTVRVLEWEEPDGALAQAIFYPEALHFQYAKSKTHRDNGVTSGPLERMVQSGTLATTWRPDLADDRVEYRNYPLLYPRIPDIERFPEGPQDVLSYRVVETLGPGTRFGEPIEREPPLVFGYDRRLEELGFAKDAAGHNAVTDYLRYSFPLTPIPRNLWARSPLPPALAAIEPIRDTPDHSYPDLIRSFVGHPLGLLEAAVHGAHTHDRCGRTHERSSERSFDQAQPCYHGPRLRTDRIGRYLLFTIRRGEHTVYLVDSAWRDKEVAMHLFATYEDACAYCRGSRSVDKIGWMVHNDGWEQRVGDWIDASLARRLGANVLDPPEAVV